MTPYRAVERKYETFNQTFLVNDQRVKHYYDEGTSKIEEAIDWLMKSNQMLCRAATINQALHRRQPVMR